MTEPLTLDVNRLEIRGAGRPGLSDVSIDLTAAVGDVHAKMSAVLTMHVPPHEPVAQLQRDIVALLHAALEPSRLRNVL